MKKALLLCPQLIFIGFLFAQNVADSTIYNPHELFAQNFNLPAGNSFRSAKGIPGPSYWQNNSSYLVHATLSEKDTSVTGDVTITYTNNSPDQLDYLWLQLDQNIFKPSSRSVAATPYPGDYFSVLGKINGGYNIKDVTISYDNKSYTVQPVITDTRMQVRLNTPLQPKGDKVSIKINFSFVIPLDGAGRFGRQYTKNGVIYQIGQWYPRMCVYDDVEGWNTLPYMGLGEFYCDYGNYDYYITAPAAMIVYGSGDLQNAAAVLTPEQIKRLAAAANSDKTITIIGADEIGKPATRPAGKENLTWHFTMTNTRDIAFAASKGLIWDAAKINLPSGKKALSMSCYPVESLGDIAWTRSTEYLKASIEIYSKNFFEYPWNVAISNAGITGGMEYPGMIFNNYKEIKARLWFLIAHEIGHNWFPMIVGSNERRYMWQDEGFNTYVNYIANDLFNNKEYQTDAAYFDKSFFASRDYMQFMQYKDPLMTVSDAMDAEQHYQFYGKTAYGLNLLRTVVVGKERFDYAFRKYTEAWAFKHPTPYDFFHCINNAAGEDLNWFWKEWFFTTAKLDQTITAVSYIDNDPAKGALITIDNKGKMVLPVILKIIQANGKEETVQLPVEIWQRGGSWVYKYTSSNKIDKVILDPENVLPDMDRKNNEWNSK
ncbi:M1 family metallopeptidase [Ferruginibacter sp. SUN106]|uniref:M1 family metallopeptidase n=1 Tax=Ferruginibacter sp. SUN106 TaxID=2978348 RepID=UPI003D3699BD